MQASAQLNRWIRLAAERKQAPAQVEVAAAGGGLARKEAVHDARHLHHALVLAQVVLGLRQEGVLPPIAPDQRDL